MRLLNYNDVSERLGIELPTLYSMVSQNRIPHLRFSARMVRFDEEILAKWVADHQVLPLCVGGSDEQSS